MARLRGFTPPSPSQLRSTVSAYIRTKEKAAAKKHTKKMADKAAKKAGGGGASDEEGSDGGGSDGGEAPVAGDAPDAALEGAPTSENDSPQSTGSAADEARAAANAQHGAESSTCLSLASLPAPYWASVDGTPLVRAGFNLKSATVGRLDPGARVQVRATFLSTR